MNESKIQLRANILQEISKLRSIPALCDRDVENCISKLSKIGDKTFLCTTILKEIDGSVVYFDGVLSILAINLAKDVLEKCVFSFLEKSDVKDEKKLFLINLLTQAGIGVDPNLIHLYVKNPDEAIDLETEKFLKMAEVNPEAQIDFLDFYFGINEDDRNILLKSVIDDYSGDLLANILAPLIYSMKNKTGLKMCINGLLKSRSYLAYAPLDWLIETSDDMQIISLSKKIKNELKMAGLRKEVTTFKYYKELFKTSKPLGFYVSSIDGSSNFSLVFAREYENGAISTFFTVLNLKYGPLASFGFSNISKSEYEKVLLRFFKDTDKISLSLSFGKALLNALTDAGIKNKANIPYEFFCWRQLTYDIKASNDFSTDTLVQYMEKDLTALDEIKEEDFRRTIKSEYGARWFFSYSDDKYPEFSTLVDEICALKENDYKKFSNITEAFLDKTKKTSVFLELKERFIFEAYFLKCLGFENLSSLFYSIYLDNEMLFRFYKFSIQKSLYEFFLSLNEAKNTVLNDNIFPKKRKIKHFDFNSKKMLELIETKWIN